MNKHIFSFALVVFITVMLLSTSASALSVGDSSQHQTVCVADQITLVGKADGSLWASGRHYFDKGSYDAEYVKLTDDVVSISSSREHNWFIKSHDSLWAWGFGSSGMSGGMHLGDGTSEDRV